MKEKWNPNRYLTIVGWSLDRYVKRINNKDRNLAKYAQIELLATRRYLPLPLGENTLEN